MLCSRVEISSLALCSVTFSDGMTSQLVLALLQLYIFFNTSCSTTHPVRPALVSALLSTCLLRLQVLQLFTPLRLTSSHLGLCSQLLLCVVIAALKARPDLPVCDFLALPRAAAAIRCRFSALGAP